MQMPFFMTKHFSEKLRSLDTYLIFGRSLMLLCQETN